MEYLLIKLTSVSFYGLNKIPVFTFFINQNFKKKMKKSEANICSKRDSNINLE